MAQKQNVVISVYFILFLEQVKDDFIYTVCDTNDYILNKTWPLDNCEDQNGFVDGQSRHCSDWDVFDCSSAYFWLYTATVIFIFNKIFF